MVKLRHSVFQLDLDRVKEWAGSSRCSIMWEMFYSMVRDKERGRFNDTRVSCTPVTGNKCAGEAEE